MLTRFRFHIVLLLLLTMLGGWIIYWDPILPSTTDYSNQSGMKAARYWFAFLNFAMLSSLLYLLLRRQAWKWLLVAYLSSLSISVLATQSLVIMGHQQADLEKQAANLAGNENSTPLQAAESIPGARINKKLPQ